MPYGNLGALQGAAEDYGLTSGNRNRLAKVMMETQRKKNIETQLWAAGRDANVTKPVSNKKVTLVSKGRGQKPYYAAVDPDPLGTQWSTIKDTAKFAAEDPKAMAEITYLSMIQSPIKAIGRVGEATWARGNANYGNEVSDKALTNVLTQDAVAFREANKDAKTGSYKDIMGRIGKFQTQQDIIGSLRPEFTSDFTAGDAADVASWLIPSPGTAAKGVVKGAGVVGKTAKVVAESAKLHPNLARAAGAGLAGTILAKYGVDGAEVVPMIAGVAGVVKGTPKGVAKVAATKLPNNPVSAADSAVSQLAEHSRNQTELPKLRSQEDDFYAQYGRDPNGWGANEQNMYDNLAERIANETELHKQEFALDVETAQKAVDRGIPIDEALKSVGVTSNAPNMWMLKYISPDAIREGVDVPHVLEAFTHSVQELKQKAFNTLKAGVPRQESKVEKGKIKKVDKLKYKTADDIPDSVIEDLIAQYGEDIPTGMRDTRTGNTVNALSVAWDHIFSLDSGGPNQLEENFQLLLGILNSHKSSS